MAPMEDDLIPTISDDDVVSDSGSDSTPTATPSLGTKRKRSGKTLTSVKKQKKQSLQNGSAAAQVEDESAAEQDGIDPDFDFELADQLQDLDDFDGWGVNVDVDKSSKPGDKEGVNIDEIVARRRTKHSAASNTGDVTSESDGSSTNDGAAEESQDDGNSEDETLAVDGFGMGAELEMGDESGSGESGMDDDGESEEESPENNDMVEPQPHPDDFANSSESERDEADALEKERQRAFYAPENETEDKRSSLNGDASFTTMSLSRPVLKGLSSVGFSRPTPIQAKTIPFALEGKDVVGGAETGSGKTGAFIIPILERLLYRPKKVPTTRVAILMPTRELAIQCYNVATKLAAFTDIRFGQAIGGMNQREQERQLKTRPDIVIATPGRFIDFMRNYNCLTLDTIEILVLDEADRMLEDGFADELNEILNTIPKSRQTMLFSATMTASIDNLIRVGLQRPVRLMVNTQKQTVSGLVQEFVRLRPGREEKRLSYLLYLCEKIYTDRVIIFFRQKKEAHRVRVIFALCGLKAAELHGSMSQEQRLSAIDAFRSGAASFLLATDLASRGLDIKGIETVINYEAPQTHDIYLHRVGRTARAGRTGRSCTLAAEPDRKVVKSAVKTAKLQGATIRQRTIDPKDADAWHARIEAMSDDIEAVLREEKEEKVMAQTERDLTRADNIVRHEDEIKSRPKKTWFESEAQKKDAKDRGRTALNGPSDAPKKPEKKKLSNKEKKKLEARDERRAGTEWKKGKNAAQGKPAKGKPMKGRPTNGKTGNSRSKPRRQ